MNIHTGIRCCNYLWHEATLKVNATFVDLEERYVKGEANKPIRSALTAIVFYGSILLTCTLSWKWVVAAYAFQALLDMHFALRPEGQRWEETLLHGLNLGLAVKATAYVLQGFFQVSLTPLAYGVLLGGALFFKGDWDQRDLRQLVQSSSVVGQSSVVGKSLTPTPSSTSSVPASLLVQPRGCFESKSAPVVTSSAMQGLIQSKYLSLPLPPPHPLLTRNSLSDSIVTPVLGAPYF